MSAPGVRHEDFVLLPEPVLPEQLEIPLKWEHEQF